MPLDNNQLFWLARFAGVSLQDLNDPSIQPDTADTAAETKAKTLRTLQLAFLQAQAAEQRQAETLRKLHLDQMQRDVEALKTEIRAAFEDDILLQGGQKMKMLDADQTQAFDWWEDIAKVEMDDAFKKVRAVKMGDVKAKLTAIEQRLLGIDFEWSTLDEKQPKLGKENRPLFTNEMIMDALYTPLVREQILPETFVEDDFSRVQQMINATNDAYAQELATIAETAGRDEHIKLAQSTFTTFGSIAKDAIDMDLAVQSLSHKDLGFKNTKAEKAAAKFEKGVVDLTTATLNTGLDVVLKHNDPRKAFMGAMSSMAKSAGFAVGQISGSEEIGKYVTAAMMASTHLDAMVTAHKEGKKAEFATAFSELVADGMDARAASLDEEGARQMAAIQAATKASAKTLITACQDDIFTAIKEKKWAKVRTFMVTAGTEASRAAFATQFAKKEGVEEDDVSETDENVEKIAEALTSVSKELESNPQAQAAKAEADAMQDAEKASAEEMLQQEQERFENNLALLGERETLDRSEINSISAMLADLKRDAELIKAASTVGTAGAKVAKQFCAPLAVAGTITTFTTTLAAAINRFTAMKKWQEAHSEALATANPYLTSIQSFVKSQKEQFTHKSISAALLLLRVAAQIVASAGTGSPVQGIATVVDKGLSMAASLEELAFKYHQQNEVEKAWVLTKRALDNPSNRKANLLARLQNPTLAKYSIAYGAVVRKDVVALEAMNKIGLNRETLAKKDANVVKVKEYLEQLYADDISVKRKYEAPKGWASAFPKPDLTPRSWMRMIQVGIDDGGLQGTQNDAINTLFTQVAAMLGNINQPKSSNPVGVDDLTEAMKQLGALQKAIEPLVFKNEDGDPIRELVQQRGVYLNLIADQGGDLMVQKAWMEHQAQEQQQAAQSA